MLVFALHRTLCCLADALPVMPGSWSKKPRNSLGGDSASSAHALGLALAGHTLWYVESSSIFWFIRAELHVLAMSAGSRNTVCQRSEWTCPDVKQQQAFWECRDRGRENHIIKAFRVLSTAQSKMIPSHKPVISVSHHCLHLAMESEMPGFLARKNLFYPSFAEKSSLLAACIGRIPAHALFGHCIWT